MKGNQIQNHKKGLFDRCMHIPCFKSLYWGNIIAGRNHLIVVRDK